MKINKNWNIDFPEVIKALNIALTVLSAISIILTICSICFLLFAYTQIDNSELVNNIANDSNYDNRAYIQDNSLHIGNSVTKISELTSNGLNYLLVFTIFILLCSGYSLFMSIFTLVRVSKCKKHKYLINLNFINMFASILSFSLIRTVISIANYALMWKADKLNKLYVKPKIYQGKHGSEIKSKGKFESLNVNNDASFNKLVTKARHLK